MRKIMRAVKAISDVVFRDKPSVRATVIKVAHPKEVGWVIDDSGVLRSKVRGESVIPPAFNNPRLHYGDHKFNKPKRGGKRTCYK